MVVVMRWLSTSAINDDQTLLLVKITPLTVPIASAIDHLHRGETKWPSITRVAVLDHCSGQPNRARTRRDR